MRKRKDSSGKPVAPSGIVECHSCGCPNKSGDSRCSYCNTELSKATLGFKKTLEQYLNYYANYIRFRYKVPSYSAVLKLMLTTFLVSLLLVSGVYVIYFGIAKGGSFTSLCIGTLMTLYGGTALYNLFFRKS